MSDIIHKQSIDAVKEYITFLSPSGTIELTVPPQVEFDWYSLCDTIDKLRVEDNSYTGGPYRIMGKLKDLSIVDYLLPNKHTYMFKLSYNPEDYK